MDIDQNPAVDADASRDDASNAGDAQNDDGIDEELSNLLNPSLWPVPPGGRNEPELRIFLSRFDGDKLITEEYPLTADFIAISHVWGEADWRYIAAASEKIIASAEKAAFIDNDLPRYVGDSLFWMDILCVDQRDPEAQLAITQHIPAIFRNARKTLVVRESSGFRPCCAEAAGPSDTFMLDTRLERALGGQDENGDEVEIHVPEAEQGRHLLLAHMQEQHEDDPIDDGVLTRLWPLQEIILSNHLQFVQCKAVKAPRPNNDNFISRPELIGSLAALAFAWDMYRGPDEANEANVEHNPDSGKWKFLEAFLHCGEVQRPIPYRVGPYFPRARDLALQLTSTRRTSNAVDFILAIMPQYGFYSFPPNAYNMTFNELFLDCCDLAKTVRNEYIAPLLPSTDAAPDELNAIISDMPEPLCLGDLIKLITGPVQRHQLDGVVRLVNLPSPPHNLETVRSEALELVDELLDYFSIEEAVEVAMATNLIDVVVICNFTSHVLWAKSHVELMHEISRLPEDDERARAAQVFLDITASIDFAVGTRIMVARATNNPGLVQPARACCWHTAMRMAAMVSCGVPLSAYAWVEEHFEVVHVVFALQLLVALVPKYVLTPDVRFGIRRVRDFGMGRDGAMRRVSLVALNQGRFMTQCLFPPDIDLSNG